MTRCLSDIPGIAVGHATDPEGLTGCTAIVFPQGAVAAHVAAGVASGARELQAFTPRHMVDRVHGVCFSGGSAFGLAAATGVMRSLERAGIGHPTRVTPVPIVGGAVIYDLAIGDPAARPDEAMGEQAAEHALAGARPRSGNVGAGTGATAGKLLGPRCATKTGLGNAGITTEEGLLVAALVVLNPVGDVLVPQGGGILAGTRRTPGSKELVGSAQLVRSGATCAPLNSNTTLCLVGTNAALDAVSCEWVAEQALVGLGRMIDPPFTRHDGDVVICATVGDRRTDLHRVGVLARDAVCAAILDACRAARPAGGLPDCADLTQPRQRKRSTRSTRRITTKRR